MKRLIFITIVLISGGSAGLIHGAVNMGIIGPYIDAAVDAESQAIFASEDIKDAAEFWRAHDSYREWQRGGHVLAGVILGTAMGSMFGIVFVLSRHVLPGNSDVKKAAVLAAIMWLVVFLIPFLKYPANPPATGDADTLEIRTLLYIAFIAISGLGVVLFYQVGKRIRRGRRIVAISGYAALITTVFVIMPANPDGASLAPTAFLDSFRVASVIGVTSFWITLPLILGMLWKRFMRDVRADSGIRDIDHN